MNATNRPSGLNDGCSSGSGDRVETGHAPAAEVVVVEVVGEFDQQRRPIWIHQMGSLAREIARIVGADSGECGECSFHHVGIEERLALSGPRR